MHIKTGPQYVEENIKALYTFEKGGQEIAVLRLIETGEPAVVPLLRSLQQLEADQADSPMSPLTFDERLDMMEGVRNAIAQALEGIGEQAIPSLVEVLRRKNVKMRTQAVQILTRIGEPAVEPVLPLLQHKETEVQTAAAAVLSGIHDERATIALRNALRQASFSNRNYRARLFRRQLLLVPAIVFLMFLVDHFVHHLSHVVWQVLIQTLVVGTFADTTLKLRRTVVSGMVKTATPQMVGAFAACLEDRDKAVRREATDVLKRLLPQVQASDKQHISYAELNILLKRLGGRDNRLTLAILKALEQIGDERALPKVEAIASKQNAYPAEVINAARECLPYLRQLAEASRQANTLLRASEAVTAPETLLRAVQGSAPVEANQLLRPKL